jgi:hypothetical protein
MDKTRPRRLDPAGLRLALRTNRAWNLFTLLVGRVGKTIRA